MPSQSNYVLIKLVGFPNYENGSYVKISRDQLMRLVTTDEFRLRDKLFKIKDKILNLEENIFEVVFSETLLESTKTVKINKKDAVWFNIKL